MGTKIRALRREETGAHPRRREGRRAYSRLAEAVLRALYPKTPLSLEL